MKQGLLIVVSGPSGTGKGTVCGKLLAETPKLAYSISATTENVDAAKAFLTFLFSAENQKKYSESLGSPSAFKDVEAAWAPEGFVKDVTAVLNSAVNIGFTNEKPAGFSGDDAGRMVQDLLAGTYDAQGFAEAYEKAWNEGF